MGQVGTHTIYMVIYSNSNKPKGRFLLLSGLARQQKLFECQPADWPVTPIGSKLLISMDSLS